MKKRFLTVLLAVVMAVITVFSFAACSSSKKKSSSSSKHAADTFYTGTLSEETYDTPNAAAAAFVATELKGEVTDAKFVSYTKTADLTQKEVNALDISDEEKEEIESVEKGEIKYSVDSNSGVRASADDEKLYVVIIVHYKDKTVKYYSPVVNTGDPLTKSYYDKVFAPENFKNVTAKYDMVIPVTIKADGQTVSMTMSVKMDMQWDDATYGYFKTVSSMKMKGMGLPGMKDTNMIIEQFHVNNRNSKYYGSIFTRDNSHGEMSEWELEEGLDWSYGEGSDSDWDWDDDDYDDGEVNEVINKFLPQFDYSYFVKTKTGFKINEEKLTEYLNIALGDAMKQFGNIINFDQGKTKATADYYVSDGKITESVMTVSLSYSTKTGGSTPSFSMNQKLNVTYTDYGKTIVKVPTDLKSEYDL